MKYFFVLQIFMALLGCGTDERNHPWTDGNRADAGLDCQNHFSDMWPSPPPDLLDPCTCLVAKIEARTSYSDFAANSYNQLEQTRQNGNAASCGVVPKSN